MDWVARRENDAARFESGAGQFGSLLRFRNAPPDGLHRLERPGGNKVSRGEDLAWRCAPASAPRQVARDGLRGEDWRIVARSTHRRLCVGGGDAGRSRRQPGTARARRSRPVRQQIDASSGPITVLIRGRERRRQRAGGATDPPVESAQPRSSSPQLRRHRRGAARRRRVRDQDSDRHGRGSADAAAGQEHAGSLSSTGRELRWRRGKAAAELPDFLSSESAASKPRRSNPIMAATNAPVGARDERAVPRRPLLPVNDLELKVPPSEPPGGHSDAQGCLESQPGPDVRADVRGGVERLT